MRGSDVVTFVVMMCVRSANVFVVSVCVWLCNVTCESGRGTCDGVKCVCACI